MNSNQNVVDDSIYQLTEKELAEIASSKKDIEEGLYVDNRTFKIEVKTWLKER